MEVITFLKELQVIGIQPIPIILVGVSTEMAKKYLLNDLFKKIKNKKLKWLFATGLALIISACIIIPFCLPEFIWYIYIQNLIIAWIFSGKIYDMYNKLLKKKEV